MMSPRSWSEAHDQYCRKHGRLRASIGQILEECQRDDMDDDLLDVPWTLPTKETVVVSTDYDKLTRLLLASNHTGGNNDSATTTTTPTTTSAALHLAKRVATGIFSSVLYYAGKGEDVWHEPTDEDDDAVLLAQAAATAVVGDDSSQTTNVAAAGVPLDFTIPIVHVGLTRQCLENVLESLTTTATTAVQGSVPSSSSSSSSTLGYRKDPWMIVMRSDWVRWVQQQQSTESSTSSAILAQGQTFILSSDDAKWLLEVLVSQNHARILQRDHKPDIVLLRTDGSVLLATTVTTNNKDKKMKQEEEEASSLQVFLSLYDLQHSLRAMEAQLEQWAQQVQRCSQKALIYKKQGQTRLAMSQLAKRKLLQDQIDTSSSTLLQLEQVHAAIETAQSNKTVVQLLSQGSQLMHQLSAETSLETIDDVHDDFQDALDEVHMVQEGIVSSSAAKMSNVTDDELLAELESLTIQDDSPATPATSSNEGGTPPSKSATGDAIPALTQTESDDNSQTKKKSKEAVGAS